jgi:hypothetical protein
LKRTKEFPILARLSSFLFHFKNLADVLGSNFQTERASALFNIWLGVFGADENGFFIKRFPTAREI